MVWKDFDIDSALERDVLRRALPLVPVSEPTSANRIVYDQEQDRVERFVEGVDVIGASPTSCIELLGLRPLLVGTGLKVLDLLLEAAFFASGEADPGKRLPFERKAELATSQVGCPADIDKVTWSAICLTFCELIEVRHSLVHRRVHTDTSGALVGVDRNGDELRALSVAEQEATARAALRAAEIVTAPDGDLRVHADLNRQLNQLLELHGKVLLQKGFPATPPFWIVILTPTADGSYEVDLRRLRSKVSVLYADLLFKFKGREGQELEGRLEEAPAVAQQPIDPAAPPSWLR